MPRKLVIRTVANLSEFDCKRVLGNIGIPVNRDTIFSRWKCRCCNVETLPDFNERKHLTEMERHIRNTNDLCHEKLCTMLEFVIGIIRNEK